MNEEIFRKKSLDKIKSPESLNDYVRVSNPGIWLLLAAVITLLIGACVWGVFGHIDTTVKTTAVAEKGIVTCFVSDEQINDDMIIKIDNKEYKISDVTFNSETGRLLCNVTAKADIPDGVYPAEIVTERVKPISFVFN